jgi:Ni,Fe-hydrogenase III large subunit/Ni,Fe-hydrogenase III component G
MISQSPPIGHGMIEVLELREICLSIQARGGRLLALWGDHATDKRKPFALQLAFVLGPQPGLLWLTVVLAEPEYPSLHDIFPCASRMQRAVYDMVGIGAKNAADTRKWLRHAAWPQHFFPLQDGVLRDFPIETDQYPFILVEGDGVVEIPVGPVHAGTIEPGHFHFSVVGEKVLRLEERLGYKHKGIEKRFAGLGVFEGARLAGRISGDSTVAYALSYAMAIENATNTKVPKRAMWLRALWLERERIMNHLGDLGALGNDAGFAFGLSQFSRLKENMLRLNEKLCGHRYVMDVIVPGGVVEDPGQTLHDVLQEIKTLDEEVELLKTIYDDHAGLQDRFCGTGCLPPRMATRLGVTGLVARASGQIMDLRADFPCPPYDQLNVQTASFEGGDVAARVAVRFAEIKESLRLCAAIVQQMPKGPVAAAVKAQKGMGAGIVEGWRGEVFFAITLDENGQLARVHAHDPSWQNWPALEIAILDNIVPDFPLINKSFNLSYSGHDL